MGDSSIQLAGEPLRLRVVVSVLVVLSVCAGGFAWWSLAGEHDRTARPSGDAVTEGSAVPSPTPSPATTGRPVAACASTPPTGALPAPYWGMHVSSPIGADFPEAPIGAVNLTTSQVYWNQVETSPGTYDFSRLDAIVATSEGRGAQPMVVLGFTPSFHARQPASPTAAASMPDEAAWRAWVTAVVTRYGARLDYQVWPEPNIVGNWTGSPQQMGRLTVIAGQIIHARAPRAVVVAPATTLRLPSQREWMSRFWGTEVEGVPVADAVDAVALDPFPLEDGTPEDALDLVCQARAILVRHDVDLPVWTNEINYGVPSGGALGVEPYPDAQQAAVVARTYLLHAAMGIDRVYWLGWFSYAGLAVEMARDGLTTPAGRAYTTVHRWLAGAPRPACAIDKGVYTCIVRGDGAARRVVWRERGTSAVRAADRETRVEYLDGGSRPVPAGASVRIGQSPVAFVEPSRPR